MSNSFSHLQPCLGLKEKVTPQKLKKEALCEDNMIEQ